MKKEMYFTNKQGETFEISISVQGNYDKKEYEVNQDEVDIINEIIKMLDFDETKYYIEKKDDEFTSCYYNHKEIFRVKNGLKTQWISIWLSKDDKNPNDPLFALQKNKRQLYWKSDLRNLDELIPYLNRAIEKNCIKK